MAIYVTSCACRGDYKWRTIGTGCAFSGAATSCAAAASEGRRATLGARPVWRRALSSWTQANCCRQVPTHDNVAYFGTCLTVASTCADNLH